MKIDLHLHTCYSEDATTTLKDVMKYAKMQGLDGVAVTDHDTNRGALRLLRQKELIVIPGIEVSSRDGHILALNITEPVAPNMSLVETTRRIHDLGGIAVIAHPSAVLKTGLGSNITSASNLDAVEVINTAAFPFFLTTFLSRRVALRLDLPQTAGSDSHHPQEIGTAYTEIDADTNLDDIVEAIRKGKTVPIGKAISWKLRLQRAMSTLETKLGGR